MQNEKILDVGCGDAKVAGAIGMDCVKLPGVDVVHDLTQYPWPFADGTFDKVYLMNIIEHLPNPLRVFEEVCRVCKVGGEVHVEVVYWNHRHAVSDPQHVTFYNEHTWDFLTGERKGYYTKARFQIKSLDFIYDSIAKRIFWSKWLMNKLSYFLCNIRQGMKVVLIKA